MNNIICMCGQCYWQASGLLCLVKWNNLYTFHLTYLSCLLNLNRTHLMRTDNLIVLSDTCSDYMWKVMLKKM